MINVLFAALAVRWDEYEAPLRKAFEEYGIDANLSLDMPPEEVDYIIYAPNSRVQDFTPYTRCKAVLSLWAGVETIVNNPTLTQPLCRMVDPALTQGMIEWVTGHVLRHHLRMDAHIHAKPGQWEPSAPPLATERKIAVLGFGMLGRACAAALNTLGFDVHGFARSPTKMPGVTCHTDLRAALDGAHGVVLLLPDTPATNDVLNTTTLSWLSPGAFVLNPGRGTLIDDQALLAALDSGQVSHATLDVFRTEPLPETDPYWHHPNVTVTPHIASETRAASASRVLAQNIKRGETGTPFVNLVDRSRGY